jgi:hypothetical protein
MLDTDQTYSTGDHSLEHCDEQAESASTSRHLPREQLDRFCALMALHGNPVSARGMRRDREYAMWQLARAHATDDPPLRNLAAQLFTVLEPIRH